MPTSQPGTGFLQAMRRGKAGNVVFYSVAMMSEFCPNRVGVMGKALRSQWIFFFFIQFLVNVRGNFSFTFTLKHEAPFLSNILPQSEFSQQAPERPRMKFSSRLLSAYGRGVVL